MKQNILCSLVPAYEHAPSAMKLVKEQTEDFFRAFLSIEGERHILIVPCGVLEFAVPEGVTVVEAPTAFGLTYLNRSALHQVSQGEKPIPFTDNGSYKNDTEKYVTAEELLGKRARKVYVKAGTEITPFMMNKGITPAEILGLYGDAPECKGMYFGYPMGFFVAESDFLEKLDLITDYVELILKHECALDRLSSIMDHYMRESCGRCVFGHEGLTQIKMVLGDITAKKAKPSDFELLRDLIEEMTTQSLCESGRIAAASYESALECFHDEITGHVSRKVCEAGVCQKYLTYHILPDLCTGCGDCLEECEDDAILGKKKFIHVIDQEECTQCGRCLKACEEGAIVKAGAEKPKGPKKPIPVNR